MLTGQWCGAETPAPDEAAMELTKTAAEAPTAEPEAAKDDSPEVAPAETELTKAAAPEVQCRFLAANSHAESMTKPLAMHYVFGLCMSLCCPCPYNSRWIASGTIAVALSARTHGRSSLLIVHRSLRQRPQSLLTALSRRPLRLCRSRRRQRRLAQRRPCRTARLPPQRRCDITRERPDCRRSIMWLTCGRLPVL